MKIAISLPDEIVEAAERLALRLGKSRSALHAQAMAEYLARHDSDKVTEAMNAACEAAGEIEEGPFVTAAARRALERSEW